MAFLGGLGKLFNNLTAPIGVRLFGGKDSIYPDAGLGDVQQQQLQKAQGYGNQLAGLGSQLLGTGREPGLSVVDKLNQAESDYANAAGSPLGPLEGEMGYFNPALSLFLKSAGVPDFLAGEGQGFNPYALDQNQSEFQNQRLQEVDQERNRAVSELKAELAKRGITSGPAMEAALGRINQHYDQQVQNFRTGYGEQVRGNRQEGLLTGLNALQQGGAFQEQQRGSRLREKGSVVDMFGNRLSQGANLIGGAMGNQMNLANQYGGLAAQTAANTNQAWGGLANLAGMAAGGMFNNKKAKAPVPPPIVPMSLEPSQPGIDPYTGNPYGFGITVPKFNLNKNTSY